MAMKSVTLSTLVADTGETARTINHWTDIGILKPLRTSDRKGRGNRRYYPAEPLFGERKYALLASAMNKLRLPLASIRDLIDADRSFYDQLVYGVDDKKRTSAGFLHPHYEAALAGAPAIFALLIPREEGHPFNIGYLRIGADAFDPLLAQQNDQVLSALMAPANTGVLLNLSKIFEPLQRASAPTDD
jgi:DNA-binding transcriptional MerR regulator